MRQSVLRLVLLPVAAAALVACGGGGGGSVAADNKTTPTLSGIAAVGAPVSGADVTVFDATGAVVGTGTTQDGGTFSIQLSSVGTAPYTIKLIKDEIVLHAIHPDASSGTANITPLSDALVALLSPNGSASGLVAGGAAPDKAVIDAKKDVITTALQPVVAAVGASGDIFTTPFEANGKGFDKVLDAVSVTSVADAQSQSANVQLAVKVAIDPENPAEQIPTLNINSKTTTSEATAENAKIASVKLDDLPPDNASALYQDLIKNLNNCYKDAPEVRTDGVSVVLSDACKKIFLNQDPTQYLNYGQRLGKNAQFAGMFTYTGSVEFKPVAKNYLAQDLNGTKRGDGVGRAIVGMSWINEHGNRENIMLHVTKYKINDQELLGLSGDRNEYPVAIVSHNQKREFPLKSDRSLDYVQSSYLFSVRDLFKDGKSVVNYVTITTPKGDKKIIMASTLGGASRDLAICKSDEVSLDANKIPVAPSKTEKNTYSSISKYYCTGTSKSLTFAEKFTSSNETRVPSSIANAGILRPLDETGKPYTPDSKTLAEYPAIGAWTVEYTFMDRTQKTQKVWSVARPMTVEELLGPDGPDAVMPKYTDETIAALKALKQQQGALLGCFPGDANNPPDSSCDSTQSPIPAPASGGFNFTWTSDSIVPVTSLWASGRRNADDRTWISSNTQSGENTAPTWDDQLLVRSTAKQGAVLCSRQSTNDAHCDSSVSVNATGNFHPRSWMSYSELWGKDAEQRNMMRSYNWYQPRKADKTPF